MDFRRPRFLRLVTRRDGRRRALNKAQRPFLTEAFRLVSSLIRCDLLAILRIIVRRPTLLNLLTLVRRVGRRLSFLTFLTLLRKRPRSRCRALVFRLRTCWRLLTPTQARRLNSARDAEMVARLRRRVRAARALTVTLLLIFCPVFRSTIRAVRCVQE
jgi:hypothetical protein